MNRTIMKSVLRIDIENYFQVSALVKSINIKDMDSVESGVLPSGFSFNSRQDKLDELGLPGPGHEMIVAY